MKRSLGVCYYPEHWPEDMWAEDAARMAKAGLSWVRIGEFAWSRLQPNPSELRFDWLDRAIDVLGNAGLKVILGTPTATPPRWMADKHPDMFAMDAEGRPRGFGSRRHYCFSHQGYRTESRNITELMAKRYGNHRHVAAWQTDNEYGCHQTILSYSNAARTAFRAWLTERYESIEALNTAWGNIFWSMEYDSFDQIDLPNLTVTQPNPSHVMAFRRFSSDQVVAFNRAQTEVLRKHTKAPLIHNYMGKITEFDHYAVGADLDIASWDSYPLGFLEDRVEDGPDHKRAYAQQGDPDFQAFHHDLYRAVGRGRWWIMEQQPGPVNWAPVNPAPLPGMCRLWAWEAFAHGAETVCYFRWRQAPFGQEQMHAGLLRPDSADAPALAEAAQVSAEIDDMPQVETGQAKVALIFDYASQWAGEIQPQGAGFEYFRLVFEFYRTLRKLGLDIDILAPDTGELSSYKLVLAPGLSCISDPLSQALTKFEGLAMLGPRTGAKTDELTMPVPLPPAIPAPQAVVTHLETFRADMPRPIEAGGAVKIWFEHLETDAPILERLETGEPLVIGDNSARYLAGWPDAEGLTRILENACEAADIDVMALPDGVRIRRTETHEFLFNYGAANITFDGEKLEPAGVAWRSL